MNIALDLLKNNLNINQNIKINGRTKKKINLG